MPVTRTKKRIRGFRKFVRDISDNYFWQTMVVLGLLGSIVFALIAALIRYMVYR
jgi:hypothetical protein